MLTSLFSQFLLANGAPSFVAYANRDADYGQIIEGKPDNENMLKITATGFPASVGPWLTLPTKKEDAPVTDNKDPAGNPVTAQLWWDEEEKKIRTEIKNPKKKTVTTMQRHMDDNDVLHLKCTVTKEDGTQTSFDCTFKRTG